MKLKLIFLLTIMLTLINSSPRCQEPTYTQGVNIFIETGVTQPDRIPAWYAPMVAMPYAPVFEILATKGTQGRYYQRTYAVTIKDIIKWHGHDCEGITHVSNCCKIAFDILFPDGITGPCWSDGLAFLTGARLQYGTLGFFKNKDYNHAVILYREDTGVAVLATLKKGINNIPDEPVVLPGEITWKTKVDMQKVIDLKRVVKNAKGKPDPYQVDLLRYYQWEHVNDILSRPLNESYQAEIIKNFRWEDWVDTTKTVPNPHKRGDIRLKNYPYRDRPVSAVK
jgi:hypothetical protein